MPITIKWDEAHARYTVSEPNWPGGEVVPAAVLADFRSIIANVAEALMPDSPKDSREAEFAIDGMGACQIIRRRTSELLSARKRIVELESDARTGEELDRDDAMLLEAFVAIMALVAATVLPMPDYFAINARPEAFATLHMVPEQLSELSKLAGEELAGRPGGLNFF